MNTFVVDTTAPTLLQVTAVTTPTKDTTPSYVFASPEVGTISYGGSCDSDNTSATAGLNTITFNTLSDATYSNCTITVTDSAGNAYITGYTGGELDGNTSLGSNDFFLLKYNSSGVLQ